VIKVTTLREKIGQMMMVGLPGVELGAQETSFLSACHVGGIIFFSHNLENPEQIFLFCRALREHSKSELPPFIAIDQEGGRVHRLPEPFTHFPPAAALGRAHRADLAYRVGLATARELAAVGINLDFAPVLDVLSNPKNPVIGDRSFGSDPDQVATLGWRVVEGLRSGGVIPCGKHFPGHGDTSRDSHLELPVVNRTIESVRAVELVPFARACRNAIESLMTAHVLFPALDDARPATLSRAIMNGLLRRELSYDGVVFTDDLEMKAISEHYGLREAALLAVEAGADVLLFCHDLAQAAGGFESLLGRAEKDARIRERVEESCGRIERLKKRYLGSFTAPRESTRELKFSEHRQIGAEITAACMRNSQ
jgi:beta-N-acetylhexosaminidase